MRTHQYKIIKRILVFLTAALVLSLVPVFGEDSGMNRIVDSNHAQLMWTAASGTSSAPATPPILYDGNLYTAAGSHLVKIDAQTGKCENCSDFEGTTYVATNPIPILHADGKFFVSTKVSNTYQIEAVSDDLTGGWKMDKAVSGQLISPVIYHNGKVYSGSWSGEKADGSYFCLDASDGSTEWTFTPSSDSKEKVTPRGFYWAGAYVTDNYLAVGSDDGCSNDDTDDSASGSDGSAILYILNPKTGELLDELTGVKGDIRSTVVYNDGCLYFVTKGNYLYRVPVSDSGELGTAERLNLGGAMTGTPVIRNGRLYIGVSGSDQSAQLSIDGGHRFVAIDLGKFSSAAKDAAEASDTAAEIEASSEAISAQHETPGYPQVTASDGGTDADGNPVFYFTLNAKPGGIYCFIDDGTAEGKFRTIYEPPESMADYCLSTVTVGSDGTLYYKNDSENVFAVGYSSAYAEKISVQSGSAEAKWSEPFKPYHTDYDLTVNRSEAEISVELPAGQSAEIRKGDEKIPDGKIAVTTSPETVKVIVTGKDGSDKRTYNLNIRSSGASAALSDLRVSHSNTENQSLISLNQSSSVYYTDWTEYPADYDGGLFYRVWPEAADNGTVKVTAGTNIESVKQSSTNPGMYLVYLKDPDQNGVVKIKVTSENGSNTKSYSLILNRTIEGASVSSLPDATYSGKAIHPSVQVSWYGVSLSKGTDYTVSYGSNKNIGKGTVTVTGAGKFRGTFKKTFCILPKKTSIRKLAASKRQLTVKYAKVSGGCRYQTGYRKNGSKTWKYTTSSSNHVSIKKLTNKKYYYIRVRAYKTVSGKKYYGAWSAAKKVKIR